ncbi:hydroxymethylbilane synthase [Streptomyces sp. AC1-42W]|uniref:hydroxymethylbilane synthase n=1 Tax=Streptomyces sp. AC1-42W TaxID=2218666 RepID=UPI000DABDB29|nr:hydroxymethylbilane synthase [Streptomyces sp. AC1-42W]PZT75455.1 hydroxymethylbilane synthase [Streptomyces sp. AC1-42W]
MAPLRIGARASLMSLSQSAPILAALAPVPTLLRSFAGEDGDREVNRAALSEDGVFSRQIETALLAGEIDVAVHCLKDASAHDVPGLSMAAYLHRDDLRDCLVARDAELRLDTLPPGACVGTASVRRMAALRAFRPDLDVVPLRGPVSDRLGALSRHEVDALILAACSMERLGLSHRINERIHAEIICPPLGAAIIALQTREGDSRTRRMISGLNHPATEIEAEAERFVLRQLGGFCNAPLAGYCTTNEATTTTYTVRARSFSADGEMAIDVRSTGTDAKRTAAEVCRRLTRHSALNRAAGQGLVG